VGDRQELSRQGRDPGRSEGDLARSGRGAPPSPLRRRRQGRKVSRGRDGQGA
jgi:hypothetical protein